MEVRAGLKAVVAKPWTPIPKHGYLIVRANERVLVLHDAGWLYADAAPRAFARLRGALCAKSQKQQ